MERVVRIDVVPVLGSSWPHARIIRTDETVGDVTYRPLSAPDAGTPPRAFGPGAALEAAVPLLLRRRRDVRFALRIGCECAHAFRCVSTQMRHPA